MLIPGRASLNETCNLRDPGIRREYDALTIAARSVSAPAALSSGRVFVRKSLGTFDKSPTMIRIPE